MNKLLANVLLLLILVIIITKIGNHLTKSINKPITFNVESIRKNELHIPSNNLNIDLSTVDCVPSLYLEYKEGYFYCSYNNKIIFNSNTYTCPKFRVGKSIHPLSCFNNQLLKEIKDSIDKKFYIEYN